MRGRRARSGALAVLVGTAVVLVHPGPLSAHDAGITSVARVHLQQTGDRRYRLSVVDRGVPPLAETSGLLPDHCRPVTAGRRAPVRSDVVFECVRALTADDALTLPWPLGVAAVASWADGASASAYFPADGPTATIRLRELRAAPASGLRLAQRYVALGVEHILLGIDHLLFVVGLLLLARTSRALILTVTAFTVAHSVTLASAVLGAVSVHDGAVEAAIALSIVFLAREVVAAGRGASHLAHRHPWVVAFGFGLLHGFGFASALGGIGLRTDDIPAALLSFNVGVEIGQLAVIAGLVAARALVRRTRLAASLWEPALGYALGAVATMWFVDRLPGIWSA